VRKNHRRRKRETDDAQRIISAVQSDIQRSAPVMVVRTLFTVGTTSGSPKTHWSDSMCLAGRLFHAQPFQIRLRTNHADPPSRVIGNEEHILSVRSRYEDEHGGQCRRGERHRREQVASRKQRTQQYEHYQCRDPSQARPAVAPLGYECSLQ